MAYVITQGCTKDAACVDVCPVDCIHPRKDEAQYEKVDMLHIDPENCIDCGACVPVCPVSVTYAADDLPEQLKSFLEVNAAYFAKAH